jgi:glycerol-3-phosphate dehydrogenase
MAEDTINVVQQQLGMHPSPCQTTDHHLAGATLNGCTSAAALEATYKVSSNTAHHLIDKFGSCAREVLELTTLEPELQLPLAPAVAPIMAEVVYSIRYEMAATMEDILVRRTGLQLYSWKAALQAAPAVSRLLARELGWTVERAQQELRKYQVNIERQVEALGLSIQEVLAPEKDN